MDCELNPELDSRVLEITVYMASTPWNIDYNQNIFPKDVWVKIQSRLGKPVALDKVIASMESLKEFGFIVSNGDAYRLNRFSGCIPCVQQKVYKGTSKCNCTV